MKLLLTSSGITNASLEAALVDLLGKPIADCTALFIPTGIYPYPGGQGMAWRAANGTSPSPVTHLGWKSLGLLELTALPSIAAANWQAAVAEADAVLAWGGDPLYLAYWLAESGLAAYLKAMPQPPVYLGVSAGSMATAAIFAENYTHPPDAARRPLMSEAFTVTTPQGDIRQTLMTAHGMGLTDFAIIPHFEHPGHLDALRANAERWAAKLPVPVYAIDDQTGIKVDGATVEVVSEGQWTRFAPGA